MYSTRARNIKGCANENENEAQKKAALDQKIYIDKLKNNILRQKRVLAERKPNIQQLEHHLIKQEVNEQKPSVIRFGGGDLLVSVDCADDIDRYLRQIESRYKLSENFLHGHKGVDCRMRQILVDWLFHVQIQFNMCHETLSLTVNILDRTLSVMPDINKDNLQLLGVACLFAASKFEESLVPVTDDFVKIAANVFTKEDVFEMEKKVLHATNFDFGQAHSIQFLRRYRFYTSPEQHVYQFAKYICDVALVTYQLAHYIPSTIAATALWLASYTFDLQLNSKHLFTEVFMLKEDILVDTARLFVDYVIQFADPNEKRYYALRQKHRGALRPLVDEHICRLRDFSDFGVIRPLKSVL